ncbi:flagellar motor protein MotD [soil metagenome]
MARKKFEEEHENHDRWLVSYADFITLLFAFFVVMYAISQVNEGKYKVLSNALGTAFGKSANNTPTREDPAVNLDRLKTQALQKQRATEAAIRKEREQMTLIARNLLKALGPLVSQGKVRVTQNSRGISVEINASVLFAPGEAKLTPESSQALKAVAVVLQEDTHSIQVEGHTDNVPISTAVFPSNWELSAVRASSVVRLFMDNGIAESRLLAVGHGAKQPVAPNDSPENRLRNRRVEITILTGLPDVAKEVQVGVVNPQ